MDEMASDGRNIIFENSRVKTRWGYNDIGTNLPLDSQNRSVTCVAEYKELRGASTTKVAFTSNNIYIYNDSTSEWEVITPVLYNTGTVTWPTNGAISTFDTGTIADSVANVPISICSPAANKIAVAYCLSSVGVCRVGTIAADGAITWGATSNFYAGRCEYVSICSPDADKIAIAYRDIADSGHGKCVVNTISGTTLGAWGATSEFIGSNCLSTSICSPSTDKIAVAYSYYPLITSACKANTISGSTLQSWGAESAFTPNAAGGYSICSPSSDKVAVTFQDNSDSDKGKCVVNTLSGVTFQTWGTVSTFEESTIGNRGNISICSPSADKVAIAYNDTADSNKGKCIVNTISGTTLGTWGSSSEFNSNSVSGIYICSQDTDKIAIGFFDNSSGICVVSDITATTLGTWSADIEFETGAIEFAPICPHDTNRVAVAYNDVDDTYDGKARAINLRVEGSGTTWDGTWTNNLYEIKFGTNLVDGTGVPDTWHLIEDFVDADTLYIGSYPSIVQAGVSYVLRQNFNSSESDYFDACNMVSDLTAQNEWLIVTNGVELPFKYTGSGDASALGGTPPYSKYCLVYYGHLLLGNCKDNATGNALPQSVYWSVRGNPEDWTNSGYGFVDLLDNDDEITGMEILGERAFIFKERSIVGCTYTGQADPAFVFTEDMITEVGCPSGRTIVNTGREIIFLASDNIYSFNGFEVAPVGSPIIDDLLGVLNTTYDYKSHAVNLPTKNLYCLFITTTSDTNPDLCYVYHYYEKSWTIWALPDNITATTVLEDDTIMMGDSAGYVYLIDFTDTNDNGTNISAYIDTKDFNFISQQIGEFTARINESVVRLRDNAGQVNVYASTDHGNTWSLPVTINQNITEEMRDHIQNWFLRSRHVMFRIENVGGSEYEMESFEISLEKSGTNRR
jgi:hypothetical protein